MSDFFGKSNAKSIENQRRVVAQPHTLQCFHRVARAVVMGPDSIYVRRDSSDHKRNMDFELVLRLAQLAVNKCITSWSIYSPEREWESEPEGEHQGYVLRQSRWSIQDAIASKSWEHDTAPRISTVTWYLEHQECRQLIEYCRELDSTVVNGIALSPRSEDSLPVTWDEFSVFRLFNSWQIDMWWDNVNSNAIFEKVAADVITTLEEALKAHQSSSSLIDRLELVYNPLPQEVEQLLFEDA
jgi:hypothetical protein